MSKIIESNKISDVLEHVEDGTLVVFDIDNTLIDTVQNFGGYTWSLDVTKRLQSRGFDFPAALLKSYDIFGQIIKFVDFKVIEPETSKIIKKLKEKNISSMAMTARMCSMSEITSQALAGVGIDFFDTGVCAKKIQFNPTAAYESGILYTGPNLRKGESFTLFFEEVGETPSSVVFVDDSRGNVEDVYETLHSKNIPVTCLRYGATDEREATFDPARSEKELIEIIGLGRYKEIFKELL